MLPARALLVAAIAASLMGMAYFITQDQARTSAILKDLKLDSVKETTGLIGAPPKFRVSKATLEHWQKLLDESKVIEVQGDGALKIVAGK